MVAHLDRERTEAIRAAVSAFLAEQLDSRVETVDDSGIRFFVRGDREIGRLHLSEEALEDTESSEMIQFLRNEAVINFIREGKSVSVKHDSQGNLDLDVT